ncbi:MAG: leucine-rich repeat protein [Bacteroidales bacterium]|nr:leucine-rich repeat protein [Bacteroidales bacterium]
MKENRKLKLKGVKLLALFTLLFSTANTFAQNTIKKDDIIYNITNSTMGKQQVEVGDNKSCTLEEVIIPERVWKNGISYNVTRIGNKAFYCNNYLTSITIPSCVDSIGKYAFNGCYRLTSISIPYGVKSIEDYAFRQLYITSIKIPKTVTSIGTGAFVECEKLTSITVDNNNTKYESPTGSNAIIDKSTNTLIAGCCNTIIPKGVKVIGNIAFDGCKITSISIPNGVDSLVWSCFGNCKSLKTVTIPKSVKSIGDYVFAYDYDLESIQLNWDEPIEINTSCFERIELSELTLYVPKGKISNYEKADVWKDFGKILESSFEYEGIWYNITDLVNKTVEIEDNKSCKLKEVEIPEIVEYNGVEFTVTSIGESAFAGSSLESIVIPKSVKSIGDDAFAGCSKLTTIKLNWNNDILAFNSKWGIDLNKVTLYVPKDIADSYKTKGWECDNIKKMLKVTLSVNDEKCGKIKGNENVISGETEIYTAIPNTGYHFVKWEGVSNTENPLEIKVDNNFELKAIFAIDQHAIALSGDNGTLSGNGTYNYGEIVTIEAKPNDGYHFIKWSDNNTDNPREIIVTKDYNLTATFEQHISELINMPVTCTEDGLKDGSKCSVCGVILKEPETIKALGHTYGDPTFIWTEDKTSVEGVIVCGNDKSHTLSGGSKEISTDTTKATCTEKGKIVYSATVEINGTKYTPKETVEIRALGHSYGAPVFTWTDYTKAVATFTCERGDTTITVEGKITSEKTVEPTATQKGKMVYTATFEFNGNKFTDKKEQDLDPTPTNEISQTSQYKVWGYNGVVYIETEITDSQVNIFDLNGRLIKSQSLTNSHTEITINKKGVVVVVIDNISYKVVL